MNAVDLKPSHSDSATVSAPPAPAGRQRKLERSSLTLRLARWWYVLRYYRTSQLIHRLVRNGRRATWNLTGRSRVADWSGPTPKIRDNAGLRLLLARNQLSRPANQARESVRRIQSGCFRFLGEERQVGNPCDWHSPTLGTASALWKFHLQYHEDLLDFAVEYANTGDSSLMEHAWSHVDCWIEQNPLQSRDDLGNSWHPFCISRRLPVWVVLWQAMQPEGSQSERVLQSLVRQASFLESHLEWDLGGNHLLENAKAMVVAGAFVSGPDADRWLEKGIRILRKELPEQILPHGEHYERSPMYHAQTLHSLLDVYDAVKDVDPVAATFCGEYIAGMAAFLEAILHPDGEIPLFGDSCFCETPPASVLISESRRIASASSSVEASRVGNPNEPASGGTCRGDYWIWRSGSDCFLFDAAPVGPDSLPAHAHSDLLTFEASVAGRRLFVDSGVFCYEEGPMRQYCRSTKAHNVLQVDDVEHCDTWSRFRLGRRGWPVDFEHGSRDGFSWARADHNAYRHLGISRAGRWIACRDGGQGPWFCVDTVNGTGQHNLCHRLHVHPDIMVEAAGELSVRLLVGDEECELFFLTPGRLTVEDDWYCPEFGQRTRSRTIVWSAQSAAPAACGWMLMWGDCAGSASLITGNAGTTSVVWNEDGIRLELPICAS